MKYCQERLYIVILLPNKKLYILWHFQKQLMPNLTIQISRDFFSTNLYVLSFSNLTILLEITHIKYSKISPIEIHHAWWIS